MKINPLNLKTVFMLLMVFQFFVTATATAEERASCRVCGMWIDEYKKTAAELVYKDGSKQFTCGVACMLREVEDAGGISAFKSVKVHDWVSGELVDAEKAVYVLGSNVIPDMVPNYIAFANRDEAVAFAAKEGGEIIDFNIAYQDVSPVGTTAPFRLRTAVTPGKGNFSVGFVYGYNQKDSIKNRNDTLKPDDFIAGNRAQPQAPKKMQIQQQALTFNYSPTDDLALFANIPWFERESTTFARTPVNSNNIRKNKAETDGIGDIVLEGRYNFWRSTRWDKFATVLLGTSLPSGRFDGTRALSNGRMLVSRGPGLQLGKGTATFTGGLLYSQRWQDFWLHTTAMYTVNPENSDKFAFGDVASAGMGLHYTPNYDLMVGVEFDASYTEKNRDNGFKLGNSGGTAVNVAFVSDYRFLNAFGGNFKLRGSIGFPIYENLNVNNMRNAANQPFSQVQLGDGFFANAAIVWTFRDSPQH